MTETNIGWADKNLNFYTWKCNKVSPGCKNCYAEALAKRAGNDFNGIPQWRISSANDYKMLRDGDSVFVNTMSDTFHEGVDPGMIESVFAYCVGKPKVNFLILTKRINRALETPGLPWADNIYLGTSVETYAYGWRIASLRACPAAHKFVSFEPLLGDMGRLDLRGIDGVITGGESGPNRRHFEPQWALNILEQCQRDGADFFHKQGSAYQPGKDRLLNGQEWNDLPWKTGKRNAPIPTQLELGL